MTDGKTTFETMREKQPCEPNKLKQHFYRHNFNIFSDVVDSIELKDAPSFIRQLQDVNNTELTTILSELRLSNQWKTANPENMYLLLLLNMQCSAKSLPCTWSNYSKRYGEQIKC